MSGPDQRLNIWRDDLADIRLEGKVKADRFVEGNLAQICVARAGLRSKPDDSASYTAEALLGDDVLVFENANAWSWVQLQKDGYTGYVHSSDVSSEVLEPTHRVCVPSTLVFARADLKSQPASPVYLNSRVAVTTEEKDWLKLASGGFIYRPHLSGLQEFSCDPVRVAESFVGTHYLWGGSTCAGLDCSGLVQQALHACGMDCPRDSDMMEAQLGDALEPSRDVPLTRGDLAFWDGHVGFMCNNEMLLHANGFHLAVVKEKFQDARERIAKEYNSFPRFRRISGLIQ